jgi:hypothetical protein
VVHAVRAAINDVGDQPFIIDENSIAAGIRLAEWFKHETRRVYAALSEDGNGRARRLLAELLQAKGGKATVRELMRSSTLFQTAEGWEKGLDELAKQGLGEWRYPPPSPAGGGPRREFHLIQQKPD